MANDAYDNAVLVAADEGVLESPSDAVHINCSVAGLVVLKLAKGGTLPVQLVVGVTRLPYRIKGYTATGSSGTFSVYALFGD